MSVMRVGDVWVGVPSLGVAVQVAMMRFGVRVLLSGKDRHA